MPISAAAAASSAWCTPFSAPPAREHDPMTIDTNVNLSRRAFAIGAASAVVGLTIGFRWASAQGTQGAQAGPPVPPMIKDNPRLDAWVRIAPDGTITVMTGRVELGQGILTAMRQVAAEELHLAPS